jgi:tRNA(adenine34) deaminase
MDEVIIGCMSPKSGCAGSVLNLLEMDGFNHKVKVRRGVLETECAGLMRQFFRELRLRLKEEKNAAASLDG